MDYFALTEIDYNKPRSEIVYYHDASESSGEGMVNDSKNCWMICVIQALRGSSVFRDVYTPKDNEQNSLKKELFGLFDISEGNNGQKRRTVKADEIRRIKKLIVKEGLAANTSDGYHEEPFLRFLLKKLGAKPIEYAAGPKAAKKKQTILTIAFSEQKELRSVQNLLESKKIAFGSKNKAPKFLPIFLDRPHITRIDENNKKRKEASRTPIIPSYEITVPILHSKAKARYRLASMTVGRDSYGHVYTYVIEKDNKGKLIWVEYNDKKVTLHKEPETKKAKSAFKAYAI